MVHLLQVGVATSIALPRSKGNHLDPDVLCEDVVKVPFSPLFTTSHSVPLAEATLDTSVIELKNLAQISDSGGLSTRLK